VFSARDDWLGRRKFLTALGCGLAAFPTDIPAGADGRLAGGRPFCRPHQASRRTARRALGRHQPGRAGQLRARQSLDTAGAFLGPLLAIVLMWLTASHFTAVFWFAVIPHSWPWAS
jgi:hypothetical protein